MTDKESFRKKLKRAAGVDLDQLAPVKQVEPCPKCYGERVEAVLSAAYIRPVESVYGAKGSSVKTLACTICGYIELYAAEPLNLAEKRPDTKLE
jgi:hypothetical protein